MKKNGFTLIELLGVIVIIALLVVIVFPQVINSIKSTKEKNNKLEEDLIYNAADLFLDKYSDEYPKENGSTYCIPLTDLVGEGYLSSNLTLSNSEEDVNGVQATYNDGFSYDLISNRCYGELITLAGEEFYVIESNSTTVTLLAKYNLTVPDLDSDGNLVEGPIQSKYSTESLAFSSTMYWVDANNTLLKEYGTEYPAYVYDSNSNLYKYVEAYKTYLINQGVNVIEAKLPSYEQLVNLGCESEIDGTCENAPLWVYSTVYWTGSANSSYLVWDMNSLHNIGNGYYEKADYGRGARPIIIINESDLP